MSVSAICKGYQCSLMLRSLITLYVVLVSKGQSITATLFTTGMILLLCFIILPLCRLVAL